MTDRVTQLGLSSCSFGLPHAPDEQPIGIIQGSLDADVVPSAGAEKRRGEQRAELAVARRIDGEHVPSAGASCYARAAVDRTDVG